VNLKLFNHTLGETGTVICAAKPLCAGLDLPFPQCLERIPALVPSDFCPLRRSLEAWFREMEISPIIAGEFDDLALMKVMAADGRGYTAIPAISVREAIQHYDFQILGEIPEVLNSYHVVTAHRKLVNPAVKMVTESAKKNLFGGSKSKPDPPRAAAA
jgi:LysR family transcriptional activator of nhaA